MKEEDIRKLKEQMEESGLTPVVRTIEVGDWIKNAERTKDDEAGVGTCWREYWQIFTQNDYPTKCPFCNETLEGEKVDGCHIKIDEKRFGLSSRKWIEGSFIIPGHHDCNIAIDGECQAKIKILAVKAIKK